MTNNPAPMKPFYALVENKTGLIGGSSNSENAAMCWKPYTKEGGTHRIVHIPGENTSGAEQMREQIITWLESQAERAKEQANKDRDCQWGHENFGRFCASHDAIRAIKEMSPSVAPNTAAPPVANAQSALVDELRKKVERWRSINEAPFGMFADEIDAILSKFGGRE